MQSDASTQTVADALNQEDAIEWIREIGISPPAILYELVVHSSRPFTNPTPMWRAGTIRAFSVLKRNARTSTDASGNAGYWRRIWFQIYEPRQIEFEPSAADAVRVHRSSIAAGRPSTPAE